MPENVAWGFVPSLGSRAQRTRSAFPRELRRKATAGNGSTTAKPTTPTSSRFASRRLYEPARAHRGKRSVEFLRLRRSCHLHKVCARATARAGMRLHFRGTDSRMCSSRSKHTPRPLLLRSRRAPSEQRGAFSSLVPAQSAPAVRRPSALFRRRALSFAATNSFATKFMPSTRGVTKQQSLRRPRRGRKHAGASRPTNARPLAT